MIFILIRWFRDFNTLKFCRLCVYLTSRRDLHFNAKSKEVQLVCGLNAEAFAY